VSVIQLCGRCRQEDHYLRLASSKNLSVKITEAKKGWGYGSSGRMPA
jgi:hypothetical protein